MKTKIELIKNYPTEAFKNWGDYFGYPEVVCKEMTDIAGTTDWQNAKIGVLDDFGFQMINFLIQVKKVPLQNIYFLVSGDDESKVELMKKWYSNFVENEISSVYNINNMPFDLIIANPPYGSQGGNLARKIINKLQSISQEIIVLAPIRSSADVIDYIEDIHYIGNLNKYFEGVSCPSISINKIVSKKVCKYTDLADARKSEKQLQFEKAVRQYNNSHTPFYVTTHGYCTLKRKEILKDVNEDLLFVVTNWCASDKVHKGNNAEDTNHNLLGQPINWKEGSTIYTIQFDDPIKLQNFKNWWYKVPGRDVDAQRTLIYFILDLLCEAYNGGPSIKKYMKFLPHVDWSRSWTDAEILKELGLPEDFLE